MIVGLKKYHNCKKKPTLNDVYLLLLDGFMAFKRHFSEFWFCGLTFVTGSLV